MLNLMVGGLILPALFSNGYFSLKKWVWSFQNGLTFPIHYKLLENQKVSGFLGDLEGVGIIKPRKPPTIWVKNASQSVKSLFNVA